MLVPNILETSTAVTYATRADFRAFAQDATSLYVLSLLLTASSESAEERFVSSLSEAITKTSVFRERTHSYVPWIVAQRAIKIVKPATKRGNEDLRWETVRYDSCPTLGCKNCFFT